MTNRRRESALALLESVDTARRESVNRARESAPDYNLFQLLDRANWEFTHDRILADLLDPYGLHGQGSLFLRSFVDMLASRLMDGAEPTLRETAARLRDLEVADVPPRGEWHIDRQFERVDVSIERRDPKDGLLIFIENKISAPLGTAQAETYKTILDKQTRFKHRLLILLAPDKYDAGEQKRYIQLQLGYESDIRGWLDKLIPKIKAARVKGILVQYLQFISSWGSGGGGAMAWEDDLLQLIATEKHIEAALDVRKIVDELLPCMLFERFKEMATHSLQNRLVNAGLDNWLVTNDIGGELFCVRRVSPAPYLRIGLINTGSMDPGYHALGIAYDHQRTDAIELPTMSALKVELASKGFETNISSRWWVAIKRRVFSVGDDFFVACVRDPQAVGERAASLVIELLEPYSSQIEGVDEALKTI